MKNADKFTGKASIYAQYRSRYPKAYIDYLMDINELTSNNTIADIGSGTGILTQQLLERDVHVIAVEPNAEMRKTAELQLHAYTKYTSVPGTAEQTTLPDLSVDLITVAQAFHWFAVRLFREECQRILTQDANVALVWNSRDTASDLVQENAAICKRLCPPFRGFSGGIEETPERYGQFFKNGLYEYKQFENHLTFDLNGFIGRNLSASYAPHQEDVHYERFVQSITELFYKYNKDGVLTMPNLTRSYMGKV
ncbi:class I SAM-dependent methyltransferase [Paenibacillus sp. ACRRX]|uniref:class I SAM-dependent methyltransferase n=1 Tax=Paenibacillus sp. ACRRX TaxID=2918206 RepID=UPI001EF71F30|nr:class I SAM-dependent methyltransferase [Paenibacillus sp. ACRRX]MCG7410243.1 class I SAM-dependent methyltransferase [Paenibacillus sp. ACRRX]